MHLSQAFLFTLFLISQSYAQSLSRYYAPVEVSCPPDESLLRDAGTPSDRNQSLHGGEIAYIAGRKNVARGHLHSWLDGLPEPVYKGNISEDVPSIALALSGGNFRAALFNAASLEAFDVRNSTSVTNGLGGLLQSSTYMSALSGGSYVSTSLMFSDFATGHDLVFGNGSAEWPGWQLEQSLLAPGAQGQDAQAFIGHLMDDLGAKRVGANFTVTFCDMWGRALAYHFLPGTPGNSFVSNTTIGNHAASLSFSSATNLSTWKDHTLPFPLVVINANSPNVQGPVFGGNGSLSLKTVLYELSPLEFGSYEPQLASFVSLPYLGSTFADGHPLNCVSDFDNAGLMIGTSSCDFNPLNITNSSDWTSPNALGGLVSLINDTFGALQPHAELDATSLPNPFFGIRKGTYQDTNETALELVDGSLDDQNDPLFPLLVKARRVDMIVILDSSGETSDFKPNGQSLLATREKIKMLPEGFMHFPAPFPNSTEEFTSLGLNTRPVFFGCDGSGRKEDEFPILVFIPNADPGNITNIVTSTLQISPSNQSEIFERSYRLASRGFVNDTDVELLERDTQWGTCVACAAVERVRVRKGHARTPTCAACFSRYCFTGEDLQTSSGWAGYSNTSSVHAAAIGDLASAEDVGSQASANTSVLERNSYIAIGLLGGIIALLSAIGFLVLKGQRQQQMRGYSPIGERLSKRSTMTYD